MMHPINWLRSKLRALYDWTVAWANHPKADRALGGLSFAESSFFPIPPDPLLMAMVFTQAKRWKYLAFLTTIASVLGGLFGYLIGFALLESVGSWLIETYHLQDDYARLGEAFDQNALLTIFGAALTPIPYKVFTITAGAFKVNLLIFVMASVLGRGARFVAVAAIAATLGAKYREKIEKYIDIISLLLLLLIIVIVVLAT